MTVARLNRGKTKFIVGVVALLLVLCFVAIFQSNQQENDELREMQIRCEQRLGGMQAQNTRNSMEYDKLNIDLKSKSDELKELTKELEKAKSDLDEEKRKYETLDQEFKISKTHKSDESEKSKQEIKGLKDKIDALNKERDKDRAKFEAQLAQENDIETVRSLKQQNMRLEDELERVRKQCSTGGAPSHYETPSGVSRKSPAAVETSFNQQVPIIPKQIPAEEEGRGVLQQPQAQDSKVSTTTTTSTMTPASKDGKEKLGAPNLQAPSLLKFSSTTTTKKIQIPDGVVPIPEQSLLVEAENSRYGNAVEEAEAKNGGVGGKNDDLNFFNGQDEDNMANEVPDNDLNIDEAKKREMGNHDGGENNAEEDTNLYEGNKGIFVKEKAEGGHAKNADMKLRHEVIDDQGKEGEVEYHNGEDVHLDNQEEGGDTDDYADERGNAEPAVRNRKK